MKTYEVRYKSSTFGTWALYGVYASIEAAQSAAREFRVRCFEIGTRESIALGNTISVE